MADERRIEAVLFDKDGTLFDFQKTWGPFGVRVIEQLSAGEPKTLRALSGALGVDMVTATYQPGSPVIAGSPKDILEVMLPHLPLWRADQLLEWLDSEARSTAITGMTHASDDLDALLATLSGSGYALGVATNDSRASAEANLRSAGVAERFSAVFGYDDVANPKPAPDMIHAFAEEARIEVGAIVMVGDSLHDLHAARSAGCAAAIGVLSGVATEDTLSTVADVVLPNIDALPGWLAKSTSALQST